ncbi:MAG TPA: SHOCT domain-containing protein [Gemmataceae bacterium]|nr:SHOCT domain-containing protein [Gemmataceae bacterium]
MALTLLLADAAPPVRPALPSPGDLLWAALPLIGILLVAALVIYLFDRWRKRSAVTEPDACAPNDQLSHFRSLYERGEMSREEFDRVKALLAGQLRKELNVPAPPAPVSSPPAEAAPSDAIIPAVPPDRQSPPPPDTPPP